MTPLNFLLALHFFVVVARRDYARAVDAEEELRDEQTTKKKKKKKKNETTKITSSSSALTKSRARASLESVVCVCACA